MEILSENKNGNYRIYINEVLHVSVNIINLVAIQSYMTNNFFTIDLYLKHGIIVNLEYGTIEKWKSMLEELKKIEL